MYHIGKIAWTYYNAYKYSKLIEYKHIKDFPWIWKSPPSKKDFEKKLNEIINYKHWCREAQSIVDNRLKAYRNHWLTAIEIGGIILKFIAAARGAPAMP